MKIDPEEMFGIADDLLKAQAVMINTQNELIKRLMDRIEKLEVNRVGTTLVGGLEGLKGG